MTNVYEPPQADLVTRPELPSVKPFYVVSRGKFTLLYFSTLSIYLIYWFYKNWKQQKTLYQDETWPVSRAIFSIFFTHSLFAQINRQLKDQEIKFNWLPNLHATVYVLVTIITTIIDRISAGIDRISAGSDTVQWYDILSSCGVFVFFYGFLMAQQAINLVCHCPYGEGNSYYSAANIFWILLGMLLWFFVIIGILDFLQIELLPDEF